MKEWILGFFNRTRQYPFPFEFKTLQKELLDLPVVHNKSRVFREDFLSSIIEYPQVSPTRSQRSSAMRSETPMALIRRGCVTMIFASAPLLLFISSSSTSCGTWVVSIHWWEQYCVNASSRPESHATSAYNQTQENDLLPDPVSPATTVTWLEAITLTILSRIEYAGRLRWNTC